MASISMLRPPQRVGADKAVSGLDLTLQFVVERFGRLVGGFSLLSHAGRSHGRKARVLAAIDSKNNRGLSCHLG